MEHVADDVRKRAEGADDGPQRTPPADLNQIDLHQRIPRRRDVRVDDSGNRIRDVVHRQEFVDEHALRESTRNAKVTPWPVDCTRDQSRVTRRTDAIRRAGCAGNSGRARGSSLRGR